MKSFLRTFIYVLLSVIITQEIFRPIKFFDPQISSQTLLVLAIALLFFFLRPLLKMLSLPDRGLLYFIIQTVMTLIIINVLVVVTSIFQIADTMIPNFLIFGFVLPSKNLTSFWSGVVLAVFIALINNFFDWLANKK